jgi:hypothetical protein
MTPERRSDDRIERRTVLRTLAGLGVTAGVAGRAAGSGGERSVPSELGVEAGMREGFPTTDWDRTYGDSGPDRFNRLVRVSDGYVAAGFESPGGDDPEDGWLMKVDDDGDRTWGRTYGSDDDERLVDVVETTDGYVAAGSASPPDTTGSDEGFAVKVDDGGTRQWIYTDPDDSRTPFTSLVEAGDGGYLLVGTSAATGSSSGAVVKVDDGGTRQWNRFYDSAFVFVDVVSAVDADPTDADFVLAGFTGFPILGSTEGLLLGIDAGGERQWRRTYTALDNSFCYSIEPTGDGYVVSGAAYADSSDSSVTLDGWLLSVDAAGDVRWNESYDDGDRSLFLSDVAPAAAGYLAVGQSGNEAEGTAHPEVLQVTTDGSVDRRGALGGERNDGLFGLTPSGDGHVASGYSASAGTRSDGWLVGIAGTGANTPPSVDAGDGRTVGKGVTVELSATASDPDGDDLSYSWTQTGGPTVSMMEADTATPQFTTPKIDPDVSLTFRVTVDDGTATASDTVTITVRSGAGKGAVARADKDGDGSISDSELQTAIVDWAAGGYTDSELQSVILTWATT